MQYSDRILVAHLPSGLVMAIRVVEFSNGGYKIRKILPKFDFQSKFSMSKIIRIFLNFFSVKEYQFRSTFFVIDIF